PAGFGGSHEAGRAGTQRIFAPRTGGRRDRPPPVHVPQKPPPTSRISSRAPAMSRRNRTVPAILATLVLIVASCCVRVSGRSARRRYRAGNICSLWRGGEAGPGGQVCQVIGARGSGV